MSNFVLIPGAWMGAWIWEPITRRLRQFGNNVHTITLSGLNDEDRDVSDVGLDTHVEDVLSTLEDEDSRNSIVVGHSYSGLVAGQAADRAPDRVAHTVFVEAFLPHNGKSLLEAFPEAQREEELCQISENGGRWLPPSIADLEHEQALSTGQVRWLAESFVGHPGRTVSEPAVMNRQLSQQRATYISHPSEMPEDVAAMSEEPNWTFRTLNAGHWPMLSAPDELATLLAEAASGSK